MNRPFREACVKGLESRRLSPTSSSRGGQVCCRRTPSNRSGVIAGVSSPVGRVAKTGDRGTLRPSDPRTRDPSRELQSYKVAIILKRAVSLHVLRLRFDMSDRTLVIECFVTNMWARGLSFVVGRQRCGDLHSRQSSWASLHSGRRCTRTLHSGLQLTFTKYRSRAGTERWPVLVPFLHDGLGFQRRGGGPARASHSTAVGSPGMGRRHARAGLFDGLLHGRVGARWDEVERWSASYIGQQRHKESALSLW